MPTRILLVDNDLATLTWLKTRLESEGFQVTTANTAQDALRQITTDAPNIVIFEVLLPDLNGLDFLRRVTSNTRGTLPWLVVLSKKHQPQDVVAGLEAGADDYVGKRPGADIELIGKIRGHFAHPRKSAQAPANLGHILAFSSPKGGTGTTSVCVNVATAFAQLEKNARVLVVDMVLPLGTVGLMLGYDSQRTIAGLTQDMKDEPDRALIDKFCSIPLKWGFRVLLGAHDPQEATGMEVGQIVPLFQTLRTMYDYILVDFGRTLSRISLPIIEMSDRVLLIVTPDLSTLKGAKVIKEYLASREVPPTRIFVVNNRTVGRVWTTTEDIERELGIKVGATVPFVVEYMTMAINAAVPFMDKFPDHTASAMFRQIAQTVRDQIKTGK